MIHWQNLHYAKLSTQQLCALFRLRCTMFVVEQQCPCQDMDGDDLAGGNRHILGWHSDEPVVYARILKSDDELGPVVISRVIISEALRDEKLRQQLMTQTLTSCVQHWPHKTLYLGTQAYLQLFYTRFGFAPVADVYDEDGIPHIGMAREAHQAQTSAISLGCLQLAGTPIERENIMFFHSYESRIDDDLELLSEALEEVLRSSDDPADQKYLKLKAWAERALEEMRSHVSHASDSYRYRAKKAVCRADDYVHGRPWRGIGVGATAGLVMELLLARR